MPVVSDYPFSSSFLLTLAAVAVVVVHFLRNVGGHSSPGWRRSRVDLQTVADIMKFINRPGLSLQTLLEERAKPNERLRKAFNLTNAFTTSDPAHRARFLASAIRLAEPLSHRIEGVQQAAQRAIQQWTIREIGPCSSFSYPFDIFVQHVTFCTILTSLFPGVRIGHTGIDVNVQFVTQGINTLWCQSKRNASACETSEAHQTHPQSLSATDDLLGKMNEILGNFTKDFETDDDDIKKLADNPLNIIIPAYETMWRVVGHAVIEALRAKEYRDLLQGCYENSTSFASHRVGTHGVTAKAFMLEVLRLHPPTRRLSRTVEGPKGWFAVLNSLLTSWLGIPMKFSGDVAVDIEKLHRETSIWGPDPLLFNPDHFSEGMKTANKERFMPFGYGELRCIASSWAPKVAAVIAGAILLNVNNQWITIESASRGAGADLEVVDDGGRSGWGDWKVRIE